MVCVCVCVCVCVLWQVNEDDYSKLWWQTGCRWLFYSLGCLRNNPLFHLLSCTAREHNALLLVIWNQIYLPQRSKKAISNAWQQNVQIRGAFWQEMSRNRRKQYNARKMYWRRVYNSRRPSVHKHLVTPLFWNGFSAITSLFFVIDRKE